MATISSHVLDAAAGGHASGIRVQCFRQQDNALVFDVVADQQGRIAETVNGDADGSQYDVVFFSADYFRASGQPIAEPAVMEVVVTRLTVADNSAKYHVPVMLSPHSYSVWWSAVGKV